MRIARSTLIGTAVAMALFGRNNVVQAQTSGDATTSNQNEQLQEVLERNVNNGENHGTSDDTTRGPLFCADRINAPHTVGRIVYVSRST